MPPWGGVQGAHPLPQKPTSSGKWKPLPLSAASAPRPSRLRRSTVGAHYQNPKYVTGSAAWQRFHRFILNVCSVQSYFVLLLALTWTLHQIFSHFFPVLLANNWDCVNLLWSLLFKTGKRRCLSVTLSHYLSMFVYRCGRVDIILSGVSGRAHVWSRHAGGRNVGREWQRLQSCMRCKCNMLSKQDNVQANSESVQYVMSFKHDVVSA